MSSATMDRHDEFTLVTEMPGNENSPEGMDMLYTRYLTARDLCIEKDVLDISCGPGIGLGAISKVAKSLVAGDFDPQMVEQVRKTYGSEIDVRRMDAMAIDLGDASVDVVLIMESIYFMPDYKQVIREAARVLRSAGTVLIISANRDWDNFNPAPHSTHYATGKELSAAFQEAGLTAEVKYAYPEHAVGLKTRVFRVLRKVAVKLNLIPKTMSGKGIIKKLVYGRVEVIPPVLELEGHAASPIVDGADPTKHKVLYAWGRKS